MKLLRQGVVAGALMLACSSLGLAQPPRSPPPSDLPLLSSPASVAEQLPAGPSPEEAHARVKLCLAEIKGLSLLQTALQAKGGDDEQKKKIELLQKQIEVLQKLVELLVEQIKKQPAGPTVVKLETQTATLEARALEAAHRDRELANSIDDLREHVDAEERFGPRLSAQLKELFLPSGTNESALSIYGSLAAGYSSFLGNSGTAAIRSPVDIR